MTPEATNYLAKAREDLSDARKIATLGLAKVAARSAYYAAFHAAEALIVERTSKTPKTHHGVRHEFSRLMKEDPGQAKLLTTILAQAYRYKEIGDYGTDPDEAITLEDAENVMTSATHFLEWVEEALG
ncbi:MAG TPA: HEPN domain-containing protein [Rhodopila sp.]|jgi:uncharacterized protein (UPF0332 family)